MVYSRRNTDILAGNWNPELNLWGWAAASTFHQTNETPGELQEEKETPFSASIKNPDTFLVRGSGYKSSWQFLIHFSSDLWGLVMIFHYSLVIFVQSLFIYSELHKARQSLCCQAPSTNRDRVCLQAQILYQRGIDLLFVLLLFDTHLRTLTHTHTHLKWSWIVLHFLSPCRTNLITIWLLHLWDYTHIYIFPVEIYSVNLDVVYMFRVAADQCGTTVPHWFILYFSCIFIWSSCQSRSSWCCSLTFEGPAAFVILAI